VANDPLLALIPRILDQRVGVEDELAVEALQAILVVDVKGIIRSVFAGGLNEGAGAKSFAPGEVFD